MTLTTTTPPTTDHSGRFITLEGIDGAGKSTALQAIRSFCEQHQIAYYLTREPGGTALGEAIRGLFLSHAMHPKTEVLLAYAARMEHIQQVIAPRLQAGEWVISDRYEAATYAYQGGGRGLGAAHIKQLHAFLGALPTPDLTLLLDLPVTAAATRRAGRAMNETAANEANDRFEAETHSFHEHVRTAYLDYATTHAEVQLIDASQTIEHVWQMIHQQLHQLIV